MRIVLFGVVLTLLTACVDRGSYSAFSNIDDKGWAYGDTLHFIVERADSTVPVAFRIAVRNNNDYAYNNLWLEVCYQSDSKHIVHRDTLNLILADPYGRWTGKGFGGSYQTEKPLPEGFVPPNGTRISVRHIMRTDTIRGIEQAGITLTPLRK